jgi:hypothetical protein
MENSEANSVPEFRPALNGGKILTGGVPGNKGGTGRPPSEVRAIAADLGYQALDRLRSMVQEGGVSNPSELARIADVGAKYSIGAKVTVQSHIDPKFGDFVATLPAIARDRFGEEVAEWLAGEIKAFAEQHRQDGEG